MTRPRRPVQVLAVAGALLALAQVHRVGGGVIAPELAARFAVETSTLGLIMAAMYIASALAQVPMGLSYDRFGARRTMAGASLIGLAGTVVFALAGDTAGLIVGRVLIGLGFAGVVTGVLLLTMRWAPPDRFATVGATTLALANIAGSLLATVPLARGFDLIGWRATFLLVSLLIVLVAALVLLVVRDSPEGRELAGSTAGLVESLRTFKRFVDEPALRPTLLMGIAAIAPFITVGGLWAGPYLREVHGLSAAGASTLLLSMLLAMNLSTLGFGPLDRLLGTRKGVVLGGAGLVSLALGTLALLEAPRLWTALVLLHLTALGAPFYVTLAAHCRAFVPDSEAGRLIGVLNLLALIGAFAAQWLTGLIVDALADPGAIGSAAGYRAAFGAVALLTLGASLIYLRAPDRPPVRGA
ncbi:MAG TPA: MFS transporter [Geminicoccaceae bacterium]